MEDEERRFRKILRARRRTQGGPMDPKKEKLSTEHEPEFSQIVYKVCGEKAHTLQRWDESPPSIQYPYEAAL
jgi:hypothetical protein